MAINAAETAELLGVLRGQMFGPLSAAGDVLGHAAKLLVEQAEEIKQIKQIREAYDAMKDKADALETWKGFAEDRIAELESQGWGDGPPPE